MRENLWLDVFLGTLFPSPQKHVPLIKVTGSPAEMDSVELAAKQADRALAEFDKRFAPDACNTLDLG